MQTLEPPVTTWAPRLAPDRPRYLALVESIAEAVARGELRPGDRLPTQRDLAARLNINLATVTRAIGEASRRGLVSGWQGRATFVAATIPERNTGAIDLTLNLPPEPEGSTLPRQLTETTTRLLHGEGAERMLRYPVLGGAEADRAAGARWIARRGIEIGADGVVLSDGADHAILLALMALGPGRERVLVESLTYPGIRTMTAMLGMKLEGLATDADGLLPDALERAASRGPAILVLTPTLHNPTTRTISLARRRELIEVARRHGVMIIEDDVYGFLPIASPTPIVALAPDCTAYLTSFSKSFAPGLRVGYLASASEEIAERLGMAARAMTCTPPTLAAGIASRWIDDGTATTALEATRAELTARDALATRLLPGKLIGQGTMSPHRWLELGAGWRRAEFVERAGKHGVLVRASDAFAVGAIPPEAVRLSISAPLDRVTLETALLILGRTLNQPHGIRPAVV